MNLRTVLAIAAVTTTSQPAFAAQPSPEAKEALAQCVALQTTGADRIVTARWLFAVMATSPQIADLATISADRRKDIDQQFAKLLTRLVTKDCINQVRPIAAVNMDDAFGQVGEALGERAMGELMAGKETDKAFKAYVDYISEDDFKPLTDTLPKKAK